MAGGEGRKNPYFPEKLATSLFSEIKKNIKADFLSKLTFSFSHKKSFLKNSYSLLFPKIRFLGQQKHYSFELLILAVIFMVQNFKSSKSAFLA